MRLSLSNINKDELKKISLRVKCEVIRNPGLTNSEIINHLKNACPKNLVIIATRLMRNTGTIIVRNGRNYILGPSITTKIKRNRNKQKEILISRK